MILTHWHGPDWRFDPNRDYGEQQDGSTYGRWRCDKPSGLWLSDDNRFGWKEWCDREDFGFADTERCTSFSVDESRILMLDTTSPSFKHIVGKMVSSPIDGRPVGFTNWRFVASNWCGVYMDEGGHAVFFDGGMTLPHWVYGWDCASACVWDLSCITLIETKEAA